MSALYTPALLSLATELPSYRMDRAFDYAGQARSTTCGSTIELGFDTNEQVIDAVGAKVMACAIGQASAAIFLRSCKSFEPNCLSNLRDEVAWWLAGGERPQFPSIDMLEPAVEHQGRHGAIMLPWNAFCDALGNRETPR